MNKKSRISDSPPQLICGRFRGSIRIPAGPDLPRLDADRFGDEPLALWPALVQGLFKGPTVTIFVVDREP